MWNVMDSRVIMSPKMRNMRDKSRIRASCFLLSIIVLSKSMTFYLNECWKVSWATDRNRVHVIAILFKSSIVNRFNTAMRQSSLRSRSSFFGGWLSVNRGDFRWPCPTPGAGWFFFFGCRFCLNVDAISKTLKSNENFVSIEI